MIYFNFIFFKREDSSLNDVKDALSNHKLELNHSRTRDSFSCLKYLIILINILPLNKIPWRVKRSRREDERSCSSKKRINFASIQIKLEKFSLLKRIDS